MAESPPDVPWDVRWDKTFEKRVAKLKSNGIFDRYRAAILTIIESPIREGSYKQGNLKGLKTTHVSGSDNDIICFELIPGVNDQTEKEQLEQVYFWNIVHWDNYDKAVRQRTPAEITHTVTISIPYTGGHYDPEALRSRIFDLARESGVIGGLSSDWLDENIQITGWIDPDEHAVLEELLPDGVGVEYDGTYPV